MNNLPFFSIKGLHKNFGGVIATNNVSIDINKNEIFGIIGPNGAGKTTPVSYTHLRAHETD